MHKLLVPNVFVLGKIPAREKIREMKILLIILVVLSNVGNRNQKKKHWLFKSFWIHVPTKSLQN